MSDKRMTEAQVVDQLQDGMTLGIGGWGSRRKPMSLVRAIAASDLKDLTIVSYGGPDVGLLCKTGKIKRLIFAFVSLDSIFLLKGLDLSFYRFYIWMISPITSSKSNESILQLSELIIR